MMEPTASKAAALMAHADGEETLDGTVRPRQLLESPGWHTSLAQFARTTGLSVALYDAREDLKAGPFAPSPLAARLFEDGAWETAAGLAIRAERELARDAMESGALAHGRVLDSLALFAVPVMLGSQTLGAVVAGWAFATFPDPVATDRMAAAIGMSFPELWHIVRQQSPVSQEKLGTFAEMLATLTDLFARERAETLREQEHSRGLRALYHSAQRLAAANTVEAIGEAALDAVMSLSGASSVRLLVADGDGWRAAAGRGFEDARGDRGERRAITSTLRVPVESADGTLLAVIEIGDAERFNDLRRRTQISALAAQTAVALDKTNLIEDLRLEREHLAQANRSKDLFLATLSHELRTPLTPILNWVTILGETDAHDRDLWMAGVEAIERCARQELHLVEEMLDLTRILNDKIVLEPVAVDVMNALSYAVATATPSASQRNIAMRIEAPSEVPPILADPGRLQQVLGNLIANAIKFTPDGGAVTLGARVDADTVDLTVSDTGIGIAPEHLSTIFDRFQQVDATSKRRHGGLGIGLAVVKGLVELHGGTVRVDSTVGEGSVFTITLPQASAASDAIARTELPAPSESDDAGGPRSGHVLIVDDAVDTLVSIGMLLERAGYSVTTAGSANEALASVRESAPDVIISDLGMPELDGFDLLRMLREDLRLDSTPVIALTGFATLQDREAALQAGFAAHLPKPVDLPVLLRVLDRMMVSRTRNADPE
jgi:signal transduction histidine kinase/CheY-like chemotaxis protein